GGMPGARQQMTAMNRGDNSVAPSIPQFRTTLLRWARLPLPVRLRRDPQIRLLRREPLREPCLRFLIRDGAGDDHVVPVLPVGRRGHGVVGRELERVEYPEQCLEVAPGAGGIG